MQKTRENAMMRKYGLIFIKVAFLIYAMVSVWNIKN